MTVSPVLMVCILTSDQSVIDSVPSTDGVYTDFRPVSQCVSPVLMVFILTSGQSVSDSDPSTDGVYTGFRPVSQ